MITPEEFYSTEDRPTPSAKRSMWQAIDQTLPEKRKVPLFAIPDRRSFVYGMAASFVLYLAGVGAFNLIKQNMEAAQPAELRVNNAYQSAIKEFESIVPAALDRAGENRREQGKIQSREQQLTLLNEAINGLRSDIERVGPSPIKSSRLRELYSMKLQILQSMIENGEIEL